MYDTNFLVYLKKQYNWNTFYREFMRDGRFEFGEMFEKSILKCSSNFDFRITTKIYLFL